MQKECENCLCAKCGNVHNCEIIMERIIVYDKENIIVCNAIINCSDFNQEQDPLMHNDWECDIITAFKK